MRNIYKTAPVFFFLFLGMWGVFTSLFNPQTGRLRTVSPGAVSGDEHQYLMVVNSILFDRDIDLQKDYRRVKEGGWEAGRYFRGRYIEHHSLLVDPVSKEHDYFSNHFDKNFPCVDRECLDRLDGSSKFSNPYALVEKSAHPIGFPLFIAALLAPTFPTLEQVEVRMAYVVLFICLAASLFTYRVAREIGLSVGLALATAALLIFASPWIVYSKSYFSEPLLGLVMIAGLYALQSNRPVWAGLASAAAFSIKPLFALIGLGWLLERCWMREYRQALRLGSILAAGILIFCSFNRWQTGFWIVGGHIDPMTIWVSPNPLKTLFDGRYGLFVFVPWAVFSWLVLAKALPGPRESSSNTLLRQMAFPTLLFWGLVSFHYTLGSSCYGCRYWVPFLPWFSIAAMEGVAKVKNWLRGLFVYLALSGVLIAVPAAMCYPFVWDKPPLTALRFMLRWL
jgi:hypothetical protein